jgi:uncharacterized protein (DUF3820 family)
MKNKCEHPESTITITPVTFRDGTQHLERRCGVCHRHQGYAKQEKNKDIASEDHRMRFGMYQGETLAHIEEVDPDYLRWMVKQTWLKPKLREQIKVVIGGSNHKKETVMMPTKEVEDARQQVREMRSMGLDYFLNKL